MRMAGSEKKHMGLVKWAVEIGGTLSQSTGANHKAKLSGYTTAVCSFSLSCLWLYDDEVAAFSAPHALALLSPLESLKAFY